MTINQKIEANILKIDIYNKNSKENFIMHDFDLMLTYYHNDNKELKKLYIETKRIIEEFKL